MYYRNHLGLKKALCVRNEVISLDNQVTLKKKILKVAYL